MCDHDAAYTGCNGFSEREEFERIQLCQGFFDYRQVVMRIHIYISMSGKMFRTRHDASGFEAFDVK